MCYNTVTTKSVVSIKEIKKYEKAISMLLATCMIMASAILPISAATIDWTSNEIVINTAEELAEFARISQNKHSEHNSANGFDVTFAKATVKLGADIDMKNHVWFSRNAAGEIVSDLRIPKFSGILNGQGYAIKNLIYVDDYASATDAMPLAFILNAQGTFTNLTIDGITVDTVAPARFGGLADALAYSEDRTFT